jgi:hypothetical protein
MVSEDDSPADVLFDGAFDFLTGNRAIVDDESSADNPRISRGESWAETSGADQFSGDFSNEDWRKIEKLV